MRYFWLRQKEKHHRRYIVAVVRQGMWIPCGYGGDIKIYGEPENVGTEITWARLRKLGGEAFRVG